jgi:hypothetical protein
MPESKDFKTRHQFKAEVGDCHLVCLSVWQ